MASRGAVVLYLLSGFCVRVWTETTVKKCFAGSDKEPRGNATLECPPGSVIRVAEALLGRNEWSECLLTEDDCFHPTGIFEDCEGLTTCIETFRTYSARCGYTTILLVRYDCLQVALPPMLEETTADTPPRPHGEERGGGGTRVPHNGADSNVKPNKASASDQDEQEVGLLVATILASVVTGVMLVIAILMTIRRLLNYPMRLQRREGDNPSRLVLNIERACFHVDKLPCFSGLDSLEDSQDQTPQSGKSTSAILSYDQQIQSNRRTRMTPIGQEASDATPSDEADVDQDPERSENPGHAQIPSCIEMDETLSPSKLMKSNTVNVNSAAGNKIIWHKTVDWDGKGYKTLKTINNNTITSPIQNRSDNSIIGHSYGLHDHRVNVDDFYCSQKALDGCKPHKLVATDVDNKRLCQQVSDVGEDTAIKPQYTAIVVPNTETSSRC